MKKVFLVLLTLSLGFGFQAQAQKGKGKPAANTQSVVEERDEDDTDAKKSPSEMATHRAAKLKTELGLSEEQTQKVQTIIANTIMEIRKIKASSATGEDRKTQMKAVREQKRNDMKAALTPEQFAKWVELKKEEKGNNGGGKGKGKGKK